MLSSPQCSSLIAIRGSFGLDDLTTSLKFEKSLLTSQRSLPCFKIALHHCFHYFESMENKIAQKLKTLYLFWIIRFYNVGKNPHSTFFYVRLMCALLFSLDKCKNYQRTNLQEKINCLFLPFLPQIQQIFRFSFHLLEHLKLLIGVS